MIIDLKVQKMPYVDGLPEPDQKRIAWIKNGEPLIGASTKFGHDGELNGAALSLSHNIDQVNANIDTTVVKVNEIAANVNVINDALEIIGDVDIFKQISQNTDNIDTLQVHMQFAEDNIGELQTGIQFVEEEIGTYDPAKDSVHRPIRGDLLFIKTEMGQYPGQDINGQIVTDNPGTGMKYRIITNADQISKHGVRIYDLEQKYLNSDIGAIAEEVKSLRTEVGPKASAKFNNIYTRLNTAETNITKNSDDVTAIKTAVGFSKAKTIDVRVTENQTEIAKTNEIILTPITGLSPRMTAVEKAIGTTAQPSSINGRIKTAQDEVDEVYGIIGRSTSVGMRGEIAWINQQIGVTQEGGQPTPGSIVANINILNNGQAQLASQVQDIQSELGNNNEGLKGQVNDLNLKVYGTSAPGNTIEAKGLVAFTTQLATDMTLKIDDAPKDGRSYVRRNTNWVATASSVAKFDKQDATVSVTKEGTTFSFANMTPSDFNFGVGVTGDLITIYDSGVFRTRYSATTKDMDARLRLSVMVNNVEILSGIRFYIDTAGTMQFGEADDLIKLNSGDTIKLVVSAVNDESVKDTVFDDIRFFLTPIV